MQVHIFLNKMVKPQQWGSGSARWQRKRKDGCSIPSATDLIRKKHVVTAPLLNALQKVCVSRILGYDYNKRMPCGSVRIAR